MLLSLLIMTPLLGALIMLPMSDVTESQKTRVKQIALGISLVVFFMTALVWLQFDDSATGYQLVANWENPSLSFAHVHLGVDGISLYFVGLTGLLTPVCILASWDNVGHAIKQFMIAQLVIEGLLLAVFLVLDLLLFYVAFESVLVPLFLVVGIWGGSPTRLRSAMLLFLYTLAGSLFMLLSIMALYSHVGTTDFTVLTLTDIEPSQQRVLWLGFFIALAVKTPLVPFHIWLPRAHADAPLAGSMVLAGTVLKLATYGYLRVMIPMLPDATAYFTPLVQTVAVVTLIYSSLATMRQVDFKALVAYSSVSHMAVVVLGLFSNTIVGIEGAILLSLAHGVVSPALFMLVGGVLYDRFHTRAIMYYRGLGQFMPVFAVVFFLATACNMGVPLSLNWASELMALSGAFQRSPFAGVLGASGIVLSACYSIWLWSRLVGGSYSQYLTPAIDITRREFSVLIPLLLPAIVLGVLPNVLLGSLHVAVSSLLYVL
jgi:NADH-ubiquinone oxidoreductase chain 4